MNGLFVKTVTSLKLVCASLWYSTFFLHELLDYITLKVYTLQAQVNVTIYSGT